jgi:hypothetical protein
LTRKLEEVGIRRGRGIDERERAAVER